MTAPHELLAIFETRMKELHLTQAELEERAFGRPGNTFIQSLRKGSSPAFERVAAAAEALGWHVTIGPRRPSELAEPEGVTDFQNGTGLRAGYLPIPWLEPKAGSTPSPISMHAQYLDSQGVQIDRLRAVMPDEIDISGIGGSSGVVIVDPAAPKRGLATWAYRLAGRCIVARVAFEPPAAMVLAADTSLAPKLVLDVGKSDLTFLGLVCFLVSQPI